MTEFKAPLYLRIKNFILGHIHLFLVVTFIALAVLFSSCNKAKAADFDYENNLQSDLASYCPDISWSAVYSKLHNNSYNSSTVVDGARLETNDFIYYFLSYGNTPMFPCISYDSTQHVIDFCNSDFSVPYYSISTTYRTESNRLANYSVIIDKFAHGFVMSYCSVDGEISYNYNLHNIIDGSSSNIYFYYFGYQYETGTWFNVNSNNINGELDLDNIISYNCSNNFYFCNTSGNLYYITPGSYSIYVEDSRFRLYKSSTTYGDTLNIDISLLIDDFPIEIPHQSDARLVPREITLTFDVDGISRSYVVDPSTGIWLNNSSLVQVPYQWLVDADIYSSNAVSVTIIKAEFTLQASNDNSQSVSYDYNIACSYNLVGQSNIIEPGVVPNPNYSNTDVVSSTEITNITNYFNNASSSVSNGTWQFVTSVPSLPSWAVIFETSLDYTTQDSLSFPNRFYNHPYGLGNLQVDLSEWLENSVYRFNDVIIIDIYSGTWGNDPVVPPTFSFTGYLVFYTDRYYLRQDAFNQLSIIEILQADADNAVLYYQTVKSKLDDFEDKSIDAFNELIGIGNIANGWFATLDIDLNNGFNSVVNAINSLDFTVPDYDDTDILDKLDDIINAIDNIGSNENEIDTPQECIQFYLEHENDDILDIDMDLRPAYYEGMTLYILYGFEIDDNYSDDVQRAALRAGNPINDTDLLITKIIVTLRNAFDTSDAHNIINSTLKDMNGRSEYYTQLFDSDYSCTEWEGYTSE